MNKNNYINNKYDKLFIIKDNNKDKIVIDV